MLERDIAYNFNTMMSEYGILTPINNSQGGWPDRLIQLTNSRVVAVEIKSLQQLKNGDIRLVDFRKDQAAWLAKWQLYHGDCFLFAGITDFWNKFIGYGVWCAEDWREWLTRPNALLDLGDFDIVDLDLQVIMKWFKAYTMETVDA